jgi:hypothetical protein
MSAAPLPTQVDDPPCSRSHREHRSSPCLPYLAMPGYKSQNVSAMATLYIFENSPRASLLVSIPCSNEGLWLKSSFWNNPIENDQGKGLYWLILSPLSTMVAEPRTCAVGFFHPSLSHHLNIPNTGGSSTGGGRAWPCQPRHPCAWLRPAPSSYT